MQDLVLPDGRVITRYDADNVRALASFHRQFGNKNGWANGRTMRYIGTIPLSEHQKLEMETAEMTEAERARHIKQYLNRNSQFRIVDHLDTSRPGAR